MDGSIALVEFSKHSRRACVETVAYAHIEVGLKIWFPRRRAAGEAEGPRDFHRDAPVTPDKFDRLYLYVQKWCAFFCSLCLQHHKFSAIQPSLLASAILHVARLNLKLSPPWRPELAAMTHHSEDAIQPTASEILQLYHDEFPQFGRP